MKKSTMTNQATRRPRAIVFSNFPQQLFENSFRPKLEAAGIDIQRIVNVDRSSGVDLSTADAVIAFVELMSNIQRDMLKSKTKLAGRRFIALTRKASEWPALLANIPVVPDPTPSNPRRIVHAVPPVEEPVPSAPVPEATVEDLRAEIALFEEENAALSEEKKAAAKALQERETAVLNFANKYEEERQKVEVLEGRIKEQIDIRAQLESELRLSREAVDALAHQVESLRKEPRTETEQDAKPGTVNAFKAHNTRLKRDLFDAQEEIKRLSVQLKRLSVLEARAPSTAAVQAAPVFDKQLLVEWLVVLRKADYKGVLELAAKYDVDAATILELLK